MKEKGFFISLTVHLIIYFLAFIADSMGMQGNYKFQNSVFIIFFLFHIFDLISPIFAPNEKNTLHHFFIYNFIIGLIAFILVGWYFFLGLTIYTTGGV